LLRAEGILSGTTTTGSGTLTLAAAPSPPGGVDHYAAFSGMGLGTTNAVTVPYVLVEYTDTTFSTAKQQEKGVGSLTLGASISATTLARTSVQETATGLNSTPTYNFNAPSAITVSTAANVLVMIAPSAGDIPIVVPYRDTSQGDNLGAGPLQLKSAASTGSSLTANRDYYWRFIWQTALLVKNMSVRVATAYSGGSGTPSSSAYGRIYDVNASGMPGKLLIDFGTFGTNPLNTIGNITTGNLSTPFFLPPGEYFFDMAEAFSGLSGGTSPAMETYSTGPVFSGQSALQNGVISGPLNTATGPTLGTAPDPANVSGWALAGGQNVPTFTLGT
jgi:hypothetical protein